MHLRSEDPHCDRLLRALQRRAPSYPKKPGEGPVCLRMAERRMPMGQPERRSRRGHRLCVWPRERRKPDKEELWDEIDRRRADDRRHLVSPRRLQRVALHVVRCKSRVVPVAVSRVLHGACSAASNPCGSANAACRLGGELTGEETAGRAEGEGSDALVIPGAP